MKLFSNFTLKVMAIIFMAMDHVLTYIGTTTNANIPIWFGYFGKLAAPIFFYLIVESFHHTRDRKKYMLRLFGMGILMIAIDLIFSISNNIFLSLGFGVLLMYGIEYSKNNKEDYKKRILGILVAILSGIAMIGTEASIFGLAMILIFYFLREKKNIMALTYIVVSLLGLIGVIGPNFIDAAFMMDYQWMMVFAIIPILLYNGKRGISNKFIKWMFYFFYPIHLIVIVTIAGMVGESELPQRELIVNEQLMQEVVTKIDAKISYVNNDKISWHLEGNFNGVYLVEIYDLSTRVLLGSNVEEAKKNTNIIDSKMSMLPEAKLTITFVKGKKYALCVRRINDDEILYENELILE